MKTGFLLFLIVEGLIFAYAVLALFSKKPEARVISSWGIGWFIVVAIVYALLHYVSGGKI